METAVFWGILKEIAGNVISLFLMVFPALMFVLSFLTTPCFSHQDRLWYKYFAILSILWKVVPFGIAMVASPGAPGSSIMTALPLLYMIFGEEAGNPDSPICVIMAALYITRDSLGTACNVSGENAIGVIVNTIYEKWIKK